MGYAYKHNGREWRTVAGPSDLLDGELFSANEPALPVDAIREDKWTAIKNERDRLMQSGYPLDSYWFHSDAYSLSQQQGLILAALQVQAAGSDIDEPLMATQWKTMGGDRVTMTARLALRLIPAAMAHQGAIFDAAEAHKAALYAAPDPAAYDYSTGWPAIFEA